MDVKSRGVVPLSKFFFLLVSTILLLSSSKANQLLHHMKKPTSPIIFVHSLESSTVFPVRGNVYPLGYYTVSLNIGQPPKLFELDIDTGSDLTWVQCDVQCKGCTLPKNKLYKPNNNIVKCGDPLCTAIQQPSSHRCRSPSRQCEYGISYADHGSSSGVLVRDLVPLRTANGSFIKSTLAFGCGFDQKYTGSTPSPPTGGVLGLGSGKISILSQLKFQGLIRNVVGHCFSSQGGGFLFFGDKLIPSSGVAWIPILQQSSSNQHYSSGPADLFFNRKATSIKGLRLIFDSGSSYTYFNTQAYKAVVDLVSNNLKGKSLSRETQDKSLPVCWKGHKHFKSVSDVTSYFDTLALVFTTSKNAVLQLPPASYLIITQHGNVCLGILDGTEIGLGNVNIIGDISLQDKVVIYDNEKQQIGWASTNCNRRLES